MSVFYNLTSANKTNQLNKELLFDERSFDNILDNQSKYMVGIHRFKLPTESVDFFRFYPNRAVIGALFTPDDLTNNNANRKHVLVDVFDNGGSNTSFYYDTAERTGYIPVRDNHEFCSYVNRALLRSYFRTIKEWQNGGSAVYDISSPFTTPAVLNTLAPQTPTPLATLAASATTQTLLNYEVVITDMNVNAPSAGGDPNVDRLVNTLTFSIYITRPAPVSDKTYLPIFQNCWGNLKISEFNRVFPQGIKFSATEGISQTQLPDIIEKYRDGGVPFQPVIFSPLSTDLKLVLLKQYSSTATFVLNLTYNGLGFDAGVPKFGPNLTINGSFTRSGSNDGYFLRNATEIDDQIPTLLSDIQSAPLFSFSDSTQRLTLSAPASFIAQRQFDIFMNVGLRDYMGFRSSPIQNFTGLTSTMVRNTGNTFKELDVEDSGVYMDLMADIDSQSEYELVIEEQEKSLFKRNYLAGLQIVANNLSNASEYEGNGRTQRKILSDFLIDPSTDFRQYMIYEPQGSIRFYPLLSTEPLRELVISVFYVDFNGNTFPLNLPQNYIASIKLEFKPINQIENFLM